MLVVLDAIVNIRIFIHPAKMVSLKLAQTMHTKGGLTTQHNTHTARNI